MELGLDQDMDLATGLDMDLDLVMDLDLIMDMEMDLGRVMDLDLVMDLDMEKDTEMGMAINMEMEMDKVLMAKIMAFENLISKLEESTHSAGNPETELGCLKDSIQNPLRTMWDDLRDYLFDEAVEKEQ